MTMGTYTTKPGTPLGEPERINVLTIVGAVAAIGIRTDNVTAIGGTLDISEVRRQDRQAAGVSWAAAGRRQRFNF